MSTWLPPAVPGTLATRTPAGYLSRVPRLPGQTP